MPEHLDAMLKAARTAQPANLRLAYKGTDAERYQSIPGMSNTAGTSGEISLRTMLPQLTGHDTGLYSIPRGANITLEAAIMNNSLVSKFGAAIIVIDKAPTPEDNPLAGTYTRAGGFTNIGPASFEPASDTVPAQEQPLPFSTADILMDNFASYAFRTRITRRQQKDLRDNELSARIMTAIALGLANLADKVLLDKITAEVPYDPAIAESLFRMDYAAAKGLRFAELRGVLGQSSLDIEYAAGTRSAALNAYSEALRLHGVPVELSAQAGPAVIGAFSRAGVALMDDLRLIVERGTKGELTVTCWADIQPLLPEPSFFWRA